MDWHICRQHGRVVFNGPLSCPALDTCLGITFRVLRVFLKFERLHSNLIVQTQEIDVYGAEAYKQRRLKNAKLRTMTDLQRAGIRKRSQNYRYLQNDGPVEEPFPLSKRNYRIVSEDSRSRLIIIPRQQAGIRNDDDFFPILASNASTTPRQHFSPSSRHRHR